MQMENVGLKFAFAETSLNCWTIKAFFLRDSCCTTPSSKTRAVYVTERKFLVQLKTEASL